MMKNILNNKYFLIGLALVVGLMIGMLFNNNAATEESKHSHGGQTAVAEIWTCSMHPQIRREEPGDCPICGMELIPVAQGTDDGAPAEAVQMSATAMELAQVVSQKVGTANAAKNIRLSGKVREDEQLMYVQTAHFAGRIEQLHIDFEGEYVQKGQMLATVYAPQLQTAQQELLEAKQFEATQPALLKAAKQKLRNWKLTDGQIATILERQEIQEVFPLRADYAGYVTKLNVKKGDYVDKGKALYELVDLSKVWVMLDVYESDLAFVSKGDQVVIKISAFPAEEWKGKVDYIDPVINPNTRVASARVVVANPHQKLKPEMLATAQIKANTSGAEGQINVPKSAVLWTGKRSVVYVKEKSEQGVYFLMREVTLGQSLGDSFVIEEGLNAGEEIATNGAFSIDAAAQLAGKPSMMNNSQQHESIKLDDEVNNALQKLTTYYLALKNALVADDFPSAQKANEQMLKSLDAVPMALFSEEAHLLWMPMQKDLKRAGEAIKKAGNIEEGRKFFITLSVRMIAMEKSFKPSGKTLYIQHCPMADSNRGADWLSTETAIRNPYFGDSMLSCGEVVEELKN